MAVSVETKELARVLILLNIVIGGLESWVEKVKE